MGKPSSSVASGPVTDAMLQKADEDFQAGMAVLKDGKTEDAVNLFGEVLRVRVEKYGEDATECASAFYRYGMALFYKAQEESDVFGAPLQSAVAAQEQGTTGEAPPAPPAQDAAKLAVAVDKGKQPAVTESTKNVAAEEDDEDDESPGGGEEEEEETDMELAWQMLEVARTIYAAAGPAYAPQLADVHVLLADLNMERENFELSLTDYCEAAKLLCAVLKAEDRRMAELHYKMAMTLQYMERPSEALVEVRTAIRVCEARIASLREQRAQLEAPSNRDVAADSAAAPDSPSAAKAVEVGRLAAEIEDLEGVLADVADKVMELEEAERTAAAGKHDITAMIGQAIPAITGGSSAGGGAAVTNLGVVGGSKGSKRITLQPQLASSSQPTGGTQPGPVRQKRCLEDLMGGAAEAGFGAPMTVPKGFGAPPGASEGTKKLRTEAPGADAAAAVTMTTSVVPPAKALPAFLQPANVAKVYSPDSQNGAAKVGAVAPAPPQTGDTVVSNPS